MTGCCAENCKNRHGTGHAMLSFPKNPTLRAAWAGVCGRGKDWTPKPGNRLCEVHFERSQWLKYRSRLKLDAMPTLFCKCEKIKSSAGVGDSIRRKLAVYHDHLYSGYSAGGKRKVPGHFDGCPLQHIVPLLPKTVTSSTSEVVPAASTTTPLIRTINPELISALSTAAFCRCDSSANISKVLDQSATSNIEQDQLEYQKKRCHSVGCPLRRGCFVQVVPEIPSCTSIPQSNETDLLPSAERQGSKKVGQSFNLTLEDDENGDHCDDTDDDDKDEDVEHEDVEHEDVEHEDVEDNDNHKMIWIGFISRAA